MKPKTIPKNPNKNQQHSAVKTSSRPGSSFAPIFRNDLFLVILLLTITFSCYFPTLSCDFISTWDDKDYVTDNLMIRSLSPENIKQMFTSQVGGTYVPLPLLSYALEYKIWGLNPIPFHVTNLLLHLLCTFLVFKILHRLKLERPFAAAAALIYGVHPMGVESVAWIAERKDLLYSVFYFGSLLLYIYYVKAASRRHLLYALSLGLFILSLFSKIQAVSLPLILLLVDYYFKRQGIIKLIVEKVPHVILSLIFGIGGIFVLRSVGALKVNELFTFTERLFFGIYSLSAYFLKFFLPVSMSAMYPYPVSSGTILPVIYYLSPVFIILIGFLVYLTSRKTNIFVFGTLVFLCSIFFMLQIFGAGKGFMADRYVKVPYLGMVFIMGWGIGYLHEKYKNFALLIWLVFAAFSLFLMVSTYHRCKVWKNGDTLWSDVIDKFPLQDSRPYSCRGLYFREIKRNDLALADMNTSLRINKDDWEIMLFRGNIYFDKGMDDSAYTDYTRVTRVKMDNALALGNLGAIYVRRQQFDSAVFCLTRSVQLDSTNAFSFANRAVAYGGLGKTEESIADFKNYLAIQPNDERVCMSIALAYQQSGRFRESLEWFDKAIAIKPDFGNYYFFRSQTYKRLGDKAKANADAKKAIDLQVQIPPEYMKSLQ